MSERRKVPDDTLHEQGRASDPGHSAWVSANAGSGKTHVLSRRVIRLLLDGTEPSRILCLTYTKAAAANMGKRVFDELSVWTTLPEAELRAAVADIEGRAPDAATLKRARQLFARALETPGGLKIQTIHAFCEALLHQFPLEANIAGHFELLDQGMEAALVAEARRDLLTGAAGGSDPALAEAFAGVLDQAGEAGLDALLGEIIRRRDGLKAFLAAVEPAPYEPLYAEFGLRPGEAADPPAGLWPDAYFDAALAADFGGRARAAGKSTAQGFAEDLAAISRLSGEEQMAALTRRFTTDAKGFGPRSLHNVLPKGVAHHFPEFETEYLRFATAICEAGERRALKAMLDATSAALTLADWLIARYERLKRARGFLDFNDLITRTVALLSRQDAAAWVQYKLDRGIDHILVDEAQDTSPDQWVMIRLLAGEFFAGRGARDTTARTVFAVGDEKQSIYSFQGARPEEFAHSGRDFAAKVEAAQKSFATVKLQRSFRSVDDVLTAVDFVFNDPEVRKGLTLDPEPIVHKPVREGEPGYVEVWPQIPQTIVDEPDDWAEAIDHASAPAVQLARQIAATIAGWIASGERIEGSGKRFSAGDAVVLVRKRDRFVNALSSALKEHGVEVAGADRLSLHAHIAVKDLIAIGRVALQPDDDLSLAALLRSPIFGLRDEELFALAHGRGDAVSLFSALRRQAAQSPKLSAIVALLDRWRDEAGFRPAFEFYAALLGRDGVRGKLVARLGRETGEILDEFLNFCLAEERIGSTGLEALIEVLQSAGPEIKREMDQTRDEVRIMTVHAAKGLEAPVVFLVDSGGAPFSASHLPRLAPFAASGKHWSAPVKGWLWRCSREVGNAVSRGVEAGIGEKAAEEYRRLLYVGMTRAGDRLIVCGYHGQRQPNPMTWHPIVTRALSASHHARELAHPAGGDARVLRFQVTEGCGKPPKDEAASPIASFGAMPAHWLEGPPAAAEPTPRPLSPSGAGALFEGGSGPGATGPASPVLDAEAATPFAIRRGIAVHRLLQMLPGVEPERRRPSAAAWLLRSEAGWSEEQRQGLLAEIMAVLDDPAFHAVFAPGSRAEIAIAGRLRIGAEERAISGTVDRLAVSETEIVIVDYKTTRPVPLTLAEVAPGHVAQLALYRALLGPLYPGRTVSAALLYTGAPRLIAVPAGALDDALVQLAHL